MIYSKDTANREERQIKKRPPLRAEKRRALTGDERHLQCYCTAAIVRSQDIKNRPTAQCCRAILVLALGRVRVAGPDAAGDERHIPAPLHHRAAIGVIAGAGVALDGEDRAAHHADYNADVLRFLPTA